MEGFRFYWARAILRRMKRFSGLLSTVLAAACVSAPPRAARPDEPSEMVVCMEAPISKARMDRLPGEAGYFRDVRYMPEIEDKECELLVRKKGDGTSWLALFFFWPARYQRFEVHSGRTGARIMKLKTFVIADNQLDAAPLSEIYRRTRPRFDLSQWDREKIVMADCGAKGRFQDKEYCDSPIVDQVLAGGKDSVPILISLLTSEKITKTPVYHYWSYTTEGDVAFHMLSDLFKDSTWNNATMPGVTEIDVSKDYADCSAPGEECWRGFLEKRGRPYLQNLWRKKWQENKDRVYWDERERCFMLAKL